MTRKFIIPDFSPPKEEPKAPIVSKEARAIVSMGGQILLPFDIGDAGVNFKSRWELAKMIDTAIQAAKDSMISRS